MSTMRIRSLVWLLLLAAIYFVGDWLGARALHALVWNSNSPFPRLYNGKFDAEIVCVGNSRGVHGFPETILQDATGKSVANLSVNGLAPQIAERFLLDYLDHNPAPKIVLAEANFIEMETTAAGVMKFSPFFASSPRLFELACRFDPTYAVVSRLSRLIQYNSDLTTFAAIHLLVHRGKRDQDALVRREISPQLVAESETMAPVELHVDEAELQAVKRMAEECERRGITFRLVLTGYLPAFREKISNLPEWIDQIESETGLEVADVSDVGTNAAFFDRIHLNAEGSRLTAEMLVERGLLD
jgi:hypothetical protein